MFLGLAHNLSVFTSHHLGLSSIDHTVCGKDRGSGLVAVGLKTCGLLSLLLERVENAEVSVHEFMTMFNKI